MSTALVSRLNLADRQQHLSAQCLGGRLLAGALHCLGEHAANEVLSGAVRTVREVVADVGGIGTAQLVVQVLLQLGSGFLAAAVGHVVLLVFVAAPGPKPCSAAYSESDSRSIRLPR